MEDRRENIIDIIKSIDSIYELIKIYDFQPHEYGDVMLYPAEANIIHAVGNKPGITISELAIKYKKSKSACSQLLHKLVVKEFVVQEVNPQNRREAFIYLTELGERAFEHHEKVNEEGVNNSVRQLDGFDDQKVADTREILQTIEQYLVKTILEEDNK